jgi:hypothetical protein
MIQFEGVTQRHDRIAIVASGPSARGFIAPEGVTVIAVNGAIEWLGQADYWFTLDPCKVNRRRMLNQRPDVQYFAAVPPTYGTARAPLPIMRQPAPPRVRYLNRVAGTGFLGAKTPLSEDPFRIHTGNSAWGALGLAYHMRPTRIALFGVDGSRQSRIEGGKSGPLQHLPSLFLSAVEQMERAGISVTVGSMSTTLRGFPKMTPRQAAAWLAEK